MTEELIMAEHDDSALISKLNNLSVYSQSNFATQKHWNLYVFFIIMTVYGFLCYTLCVLFLELLVKLIYHKKNTTSKYFQFADTEVVSDKDDCKKNIS